MYNLLEIRRCRAVLAATSSERVTPPTTIWRLVAVVFVLLTKLSAPLRVTPSMPVNAAVPLACTA